MGRPLVLVFVQAGCPACTEYMKRFDKIAPAYQKKGIPIQVGDLANSRNAYSMANKHRIEATPTTIGITRNGGIIRLEGSVEDQHIRRMFETL